MSHKFNVAVRRTLAHEGGWVNDPADPGGATNWGISLRWYKKAVDSSATPDDIKNMPKERAHRLYQEHFWRKDYDIIHDEDVAAYVFDMAVNQGHDAAHKILQKALASVGPAVAEDGAIGPVTLGATNKANPEALLASLKATRRGWYENLAQRRPTMKKFLNGWIRRALSA